MQTKLEDEDIHIGLFAVHPDFQSFGVGKKLLAFAEESAKKLWKKSSFVMEVISNRVELRDYYIRRGYKDTSTFIEFPKSKHWLPLVDEELKLLVLRKERQIPSFIGCALSAVLWRKLSWDEKVFMWVYEHRWAIGVGIVLLMVVTVKKMARAAFARLMIVLAWH